MRVIVACEYSARVRDAFRAKGHDAWSCDLLPCDGDPAYHIQGDVLGVLSHGGWDLMIAHPPCTRLANSGVRWLHERDLWDEMRQAADFYLKLRHADIPKKCLENPIMHKYAKDLLGDKKRQVVQPHWFGEPMFKATGYELIGLPELRRTHFMNEPKPGSEEHKKWSWVHRCPPGPDRRKIRSTTPAGIANAMADQWG